MELDKARGFLTAHHRGVMSTNRRDGRPQLSPILIGVDAAGRAIVSSRETAFKVRHLGRDPRVAVCVFTDRFFGDWIQIYGRATILPLPEALEPLVDYYRTVVGEHPDWADYRDAMVREKRVLIRIDITSAGPDRYG